MNWQDSLAALLLMDSNTGIPFVSNPVEFWKRPLLAATIASPEAFHTGQIGTHDRNSISVAEDIPNTLKRCVRMRDS